METPEPAAAGFRLGYVPGATPAKWARVWQQRHRDMPLQLVQLAAADAERAVTAGEVDAAIMRPPVDRDVLHAIPLYTEVPVVVVSRDHVLAALEPEESATLGDLADEVVLQPADDVLPWAGRPGHPPRDVPETTADAVALVAAGIGVLVLPQSLARLHHRKDVTTRSLADGPGAPVALVWAIDREDDRTEDLIGIVRGRTVNSSRGRRELTKPPADTRKPRLDTRQPRPRRR